MQISVIGCGYLGATHAAGMAELGHHVVGVEVDPEKLARLARGEVPFFEPGLPELIGRHVASGRLRFTGELRDVAGMDVHFICVGTPQRADSLGADVSHVDAAVEQLGPLLTSRSVVIGKSTVPVGTAARLAARLRELTPAASDAHLAWNPEFLREGFAVEDTLRPDRLVFGVDDHLDRHSPALAALRHVYASALAAGTPEVVTDLQTAELVKVAANGFLATKISYINVLAELCDAVGADVTRLADAIGHDARIGRRFLDAGIGFGGGCLPKDIRAFQHRALELGVDDAAALLGVVERVNLGRRQRVVDLALQALVDSPSAKVTVLGAAFKPHSDDVRDSPALWVAAELTTRGHEVTVHDPEAIPNARRRHPELHYSDDLNEALQGASVVLHLTEWEVYGALEPSDVAQLVARPLLIDGRNRLDAARWREDGWTVLSLGRP